MKKVLLCVVAICMMLSLILGTSACNKATTQDEIVDDITAIIDTSVVEDNVQSDEKVVDDTKQPITEDTTEVNDETAGIKVEKKIEVEKVRDLYSLEPPETDREMLALIIYQEAGGDACCDECRYRVADVVLNRVASDRFPNTIYEVLTQRAQYGRLYWTGLVWPEKAFYEVEAHAVERAYRVAEDVLNGNHSELYGEGYIWQAEFTQGRDNIYHCGHYFGR